MQTTNTTCHGYDPCGGPECHACNECIPVSTVTVLPSPFVVLSRLLELQSHTAPGGSSPSGGVPLSHGHDSGTKSLEFQGVMDCVATIPKRVASLEQSAEVSGVWASGPDTAEKVTQEKNHFRYVKESKRKRRANAREGKKSRSQPPSGLVLDAVIKESTAPVLSDTNHFSVLMDEDAGGCSKRIRLLGKARDLVGFFSRELGLKGDVSCLPPHIECGDLRAAIRGCFPADVSPLAELSLKTSQKVEDGCCEACEPKFEIYLERWRKKMQEPVEVDEDHLSEFKRTLKGLIPVGWSKNKKKFPYVPNGSASRDHSRKKGGNWNREPFSDRCRAALVFSSGKPRVVTCYATRNVEVLTPLHLSMYDALSRFGWLLVGPPTEGDVTGLTGSGEFLSFDYKSATDNIKSAYVRAAVECLIETGDNLSWEEEECLRVLANMRLSTPMSDTVGFDVTDGTFHRGQPMGSVMSFPLLCLINKTVVDMSLADLLKKKKINFPEYSSHRCMINGDDLLTREPRQDTDLFSSIVYHGSKVGLEVNEEKSGRDFTEAEINSTLFTCSGAKKNKKTNAKALFMNPDTDDVLRVAFDATTTVPGFLKVVRNNAKLLARQTDKKVYSLPFKYQQACYLDRKIKKSLFLTPVSERPKLANFFPVCSVPDGYDLTIEEEVAIIKRHVNEVRDNAIAYAAVKAKKRRWNPELVKSDVTWRTLVRRKKTVEDEKTLCVLAKFYRYKEKERLCAEDALETFFHDSDWFDHHDESLYDSKVDHLVDALKSLKTKPRSPPHRRDIGDSWSIGLHQETAIRYRSAFFVHHKDGNFFFPKRAF